MGKKTGPLQMTEDQRQQLETWVRGKTTPQRVAFRAHICILAADGLPVTDIAQRMNTSRPTVLVWKKRFEEQGPEGLVRDAPRGPSPRKLDEATTEAIIETTLNSTPPDSEHWTTRALAKALGVSNATVARIWKSHGIKPKKKKGRRSAKDKPVKETGSELRAVYFDPPIHALIVSAGPWPITPIRREKGVGLSGEHYPDTGSEKELDCTLCFHAALNLLNGGLPDQRGDRPNPEDFGKFLRRVEEEIPGGQEIHVVLLGSARQSYPDSQHAFQHGRFHVHAYPSWTLTEETLEDVVLRSTGIPLIQGTAGDVHDVISEIDRFVRGLGTKQEPFVWVKSTDNIPRQPDGCKVILETIRRLGWLMMNRMRSTWRHSEEVPLQEEIPMKWKEKFESWFAAVAFAEEGEHETARQIAGTPIPETREVPKILPSLTTTFAAAAFAEENCHEMALEMLAGTRRRNSFLEAVGLKGVRVRYVVAPAEPSFAEAVGLAGVKFRMVAFQL
ncbi:MAG: IS630 family transposase [Desulfomonile tiedjei]|nr:IS630 family transposase [Desulfomonile tiedjei]